MSIYAPTTYRIAPLHHETGAEVMRWWIGEDNRLKEDDAQITLFGLRLDETDV